MIHLNGVHFSYEGREVLFRDLVFDRLHQAGLGVALAVWLTAACTASGRSAAYSSFGVSRPYPPSLRR